MAPSPSPAGAGASAEQVVPASVSHFIIFNPSLQLSKPIKTKVTDAVASETSKIGQEEERDKDLEDDMKEAAQILFYTSREGGKVSRDKMLRQFGLAKGLMGFTDMVLAKPASETEKEKKKETKGWWGVHSHKSRMIIWSPEPEYFIYINVTLSHKSGGETTHGSQGISDQMIVDALQRGYEDFCLLHGPLASLEPGTSSTSSSLERFWTRFAFQFESTYLSPLDPGDILQSWIGGFPTAPSITSSTSRAIDDILSTTDRVTSTGLITRSGPIHLSSTIPRPLVRYLINALPTPPPTVRTATPVSADRSSLGLGFGLGLRRKPAGGKADEERQSSWTSWVPGIGIGASGSSTPTVRPGAREADEKKSGASRWPSFGLGALGVGTVFGAGKEAEPVQGPSDQSASSGQFVTGTEGFSSITTKDGTGSTAPAHVNQHHVEQTKVDMPDLQAAVDAEAEIELMWEKKDIWLPIKRIGETYEKRRVSWIIRDDKLLYTLFAADTIPPYPLPSTSATLAVFASFAPVSAPLRGSTDSSRPSTPSHPIANASIQTHPNGAADTQDLASLDPSSAVTLFELKDRLASDKNVIEVYAKSSNGKFLIAKRMGEGEVYLQLGRKDASLTDAEQVVRSIRPHSLVT